MLRRDLATLTTHPREEKILALIAAGTVRRGTAAGLGEDAEASLWMLCNICNPACEVQMAVARSTTSLLWRRAVLVVALRC